MGFAFQDHDVGFGEFKGRRFLQAVPSMAFRSRAERLHDRHAKSAALLGQNAPGEPGRMVPGSVSTARRSSCDSA